MNFVINGSEDSLDICKCDVEKCFDGLWTHECISDIYEARMTNDKLPLLFKMNQNATVAIKTVQGMTKRKNIKNIIMQGTVWGLLLCTSTLDKLPKQAMKTKHSFSNTRVQYKSPSCQES